VTPIRCRCTCRSCSSLRDQRAPSGAAPPCLTCMVRHPAAFHVPQTAGAPADRTCARRGGRVGGAAPRARNAQRNGAPGGQPAGLPHVRGARARVGGLHFAPGVCHRPRRPHRRGPWGPEPAIVGAAARPLGRCAERTAATARSCAALPRLRDPAARLAQLRMGGAHRVIATCPRAQRWKRAPVPGQQRASRLLQSLRPSPPAPAVQQGHGPGPGAPLESGRPGRQTRTRPTLASCRAARCWAKRTRSCSASCRCCCARCSCCCRRCAACTCWRARAGPAAPGGAPPRAAGSDAHGSRSLAVCTGLHVAGRAARTI